MSQRCFPPLWSVEETAQAEVAVQQRQQELAQERIKAEIAVTQATGRANSVRAQTQAQADATTLRGNAEASAIKAKGVTHSPPIRTPGYATLGSAEVFRPLGDPGGQNRFISKVGRQRPQLNRCLGAILVRPSPPNAFLWAQELLLLRLPGWRFDVDQPRGDIR